MIQKIQAWLDLPSRREYGYLAAGLLAGIVVVYSWMPGNGGVSP